MRVAEVPAGQRSMVVPVTVGRRYAYIDGSSGRCELATFAARTDKFDLPMVSEDIVERDLRHGMEGAAALLVDQVGGRVVHMARSAELMAFNVLVEATPDVDSSGRQW